jgi:ABC-type maltose transport system permease subunit
MAVAGKGVASRALTRLTAYTVAVLIALVVLVPLVYVALGGLRTTGQLSADPVGLPDPVVTDNYRGILTSSSFWRQVGNSALIATLTTVLDVVTGAPAAARACSRCSPSACCSRSRWRRSPSTSCWSGSTCSTARSAWRSPRRRSACR